MKRTPIKRAPMRKTTPAATKKRQAKNDARSGLHDAHLARPINARVVAPDYLRWLRTQPCAVCRKYGVHAAHMRSVGAGGSDFTALPLCAAHHGEQHAAGIDTFCTRYNFNIQAQIAKHRAAFEVMQVR